MSSVWIRTGGEGKLENRGINRKERMENENENENGMTTYLINE